MFKVNIKIDALQKITDYTNKPYEQIGLLIGEFTDDGLLILDAIPGEGDAGEACTIFSSESLAKVADDIINGRVKGNIVGWYHSHIGHGVFMSNVDVQTQLRLQQFSPYVVALVIDPLAKQFGIFLFDLHHGLIQLPEEYVKVV